MTGAHSPPLRLAFAGTPAFAAAILAALIERYAILVVYSQPARPTGRGRKVVGSPVQALAREVGIPIRTPISLRGEADVLRALDLDAVIVAAYGKLLPKEILATPRYGCINVHASLLPKWRGAAPIERAMLAGDEVTGISIMLMDAGLDTGPVFDQATCPILARDIGDDVRDRLAALGASTLLGFLPRLPSAVPRAQSTEGVTYAPKLAPQDSQIDWNRSGRSIALQIQALNSRQPVTCSVGEERVRLLFAEAIAHPNPSRPGTVITSSRNDVVIACGEGAIRISRVALSRGSGKSMDIASMRSGHPD
ncbi:MAG: methionyl-tRNA formyltransferase, partial [Gammaproteobacteria bacterium]